MSMVSIIMPVYGVERYIAKAIESVLSQTYTDWELIVVNDGSRDRSREIALGYAAADSRIKVIDKENGGLSDARNVGLEYAVGEYVNFFDSDDWLEPDFISRLVERISSDNLDLVVCGYFVDTVDSEGQLMTTVVRNSAPYPPRMESEYFDLMELYMNYAWNKLYRRQFIEQHNLRFEKGLWMIEDSEFISRVLPCDPKIGFINFPGYHYIQRPEVTLSKKFNSEVIGFMGRKLHFMGAILGYFAIQEDSLNNIIERQRGYASAYLLKQMARTLPYRELKDGVEALLRDPDLSPRKVSLAACQHKNDKPLIVFARLQAIALLRQIGKLYNRKFSKL